MESIEQALDLVSKFPKDHGVTCLLIGGFAVQAYGYSRNTLDIDFMIVADDLATVKTVMMANGFTDVAIHETVAFFSKPGQQLRVDFLMVEAQTIQKLMKNAEQTTLLGHRVPIPSLNDLIAMKIFALSKNTGQREAKDLPDIAFLAILNDLSYEEDLVPLCKQFGSDQVAQMIKDRMEGLAG